MVCIYLGDFYVYFILEIELILLKKKKDKYEIIGDN